MALHCCGCRSFSTWWAKIGRYKGFKEIQDLDLCCVVGLLGVVAKVKNWRHSVK